MGGGLFVAFVVLLLPRMAEAFESLRLASTGPAFWLASLGDSAVYWAWIVPALVVLAVIGWFGTGRARALGPYHALRWVPWMRGILNHWQASNFADWLALLIEHGVPLADGIELAAQATGDPSLGNAAKALAEASRRGETPRESLRREASPLPPLLQWLLLAGEQQGALVPALQHASRTYRDRALQEAETLQTVLPTIVLLLLGASTALIYALTLYLPWTQLLNSLAGPSS